MVLYNKNHAGFRDFWLIVFTHITRTAFAILIKVSTISASTLLLALPSGIIISHCSVFKVRLPTFVKVRFQHPNPFGY